MVILWRNRYRDGGVAALADLPRPGRPSDIDEAAIVVRTLEAPPERLAVTHWSSRLAREMGGQQRPIGVVEVEGGR